MKKLTRKQLMDECRKVRKRVSGYSPEKKAELLRRGMEIINASKTEPQSEEK